MTNAEVYANAAVPLLLRLAVARTKYDLLAARAQDIVATINNWRQQIDAKQGTAEGAMIAIEQSAEGLQATMFQLNNAALGLH